jgi:hypothetical protein
MSESLPLAEAEIALIRLLRACPGGLPMIHILGILNKHKEAELRAAVWTLRSNGLADFEGPHLVAIRIEK